MSYDQTLIMAIIAAAIGMFLWGKWRHDMVAIGALVACVLSDLVEPQEAFAGFGHPAVVTVACVLVLSRGLQSSGAVDVLTRTFLPANAGPTLSIAALVTLAAGLSAFMNNVGALALLMPVAIQVAGRLDLPPGKVLMPLAFGSILGGTTTLIGTPPNLIIAGFRASQPNTDVFGMFDFTMVGLPLTLAGIVFIVLIGWRLVPARRQAGAAGFEMSAYVTEVRVPKGSATDGKQVQEIKTVLQELDAQMLDLVRNDIHVRSPRPGKILHAGDILVLEADVGALNEVLLRLGLKLEEDKQQVAPGDKGDFDAFESKEPGEGDVEPASVKDNPEDRADIAAAAAESEDSSRTEETALMEMAVLPESKIVGSSASDLLLRTRYGINLLAIARQGECSMARLRSMRIKPGDVLLMQGQRDRLNGFAGNSGCVPLAQRDLRIPDKRKALTYMGLYPGESLLGKKVDVVFIGSCTNSRISDLRQAAAYLKGKKVADGLRVLVVPGSGMVKRQAEAEGLDQIFKDAGAEWREAGCSMCIAMNGDQLEPGQYAVSTSNRNFEGRQGKGGRTFLASPLTAAATAVTGQVTDARTLN